MNKRYYPSSAAFMWGEQVVTKYASGCLRNILFKAFEIRTNIHPQYAEIGETHEVMHECELGLDQEVIGWMREEPIREPVYGNPHSDFSGRMDFIVTYCDGHQEVHECKATFSKNIRREFRKGNPVLNHLAQLVAYLGQVGLTKGRLIYGYFEEHEGDLIRTESREIWVEVDDKGRILTDGIPTGYTAHDQLRHMQVAATHLAEETFGPRPQGWDALYGSPCTFCDFQNACTKLDSGWEDKDVIELARLDVEDVKPNEPKINTYKPKKGKPCRTNDRGTTGSQKSTGTSDSCPQRSSTGPLPRRIKKLYTGNKSQ